MAMALNTCSPVILSANSFKTITRNFCKFLASVLGNFDCSSSVRKRKCKTLLSTQYNPYNKTTLRWNQSQILQGPPSLRSELLCRTLDPIQDGLNKVTIVGAGMVGIACVNAILFQKISSHVALIDAFPKKLQGEGLDFSHGLGFLDDAQLEYDTDFCISSNSKVIIIAAGTLRAKDEPKVKFLQRNVDLIKNIVIPLAEYSPKAIFVVITNPVDIISWLTWKISGLPISRIIGSGTNVDSARFRYMLAHRLGVASQSIQAFVVGEHGESQVPLWSGVSIAGVQFRDVRPNIGMSTDDEKWIDVAKEIASAESNTRCLKGYLNTAIGLSVADITKAILRNTQSIKTVSTLVQGHYGISQEMFLSLPCSIGENGISNIVRMRITEVEKNQLVNSAKVVYELQKQIKL